jgi:acetylornithine deacetylase/succinyl-diaminopimelate desuccinylase-like protein
MLISHLSSEKVEATGAKCTLQPFLPGFAPNVICHYAPSSKVVDGPLTILSGHYDSRGSFGRWGAPGADDDASGSAHLLAIAQAIQHAKVTFKHEVVLAFFAGEEQGLLGSAAYASELLEPLPSTVDYR